VAHLIEKYGPPSGWAEKLAALPTEPPSSHLGGNTHDVEVCPTCTGVGVFRNPAPVGTPDFGRAAFCPACNGWGTRAAYLEETRRYAGIPERLWRECTFASYDLNRPHVVETHGEACAAAVAWTNRSAPFAPPFLLLAGPVGIGKTHLAVAACRAFIEQGVHCLLFRTVARLLEDLRETQRRYAIPQPGVTPPPSLAQVRGRFETEAVLVLDDLGADRWTEFAEEQLTLIIDARWQNALRTLITTNTPRDQLPARIASRITDAHLSRVIAIDGPDQRLAGGAS